MQKIARPYSWRSGCHGGPIRRTFIHELAAGKAQASSAGSGVRQAPRSSELTPTLKEHDMAWTKPQATDLRYGFEITMYISNR